MIELETSAQEEIYGWIQPRDFREIPSEMVTACAYKKTGNSPTPAWKIESVAKKKKKKPYRKEETNEDLNLVRRDMFCCELREDLAWERINGEAKLTKPNPLILMG